VFKIIFASRLASGAGCITKHQETDACGCEDEMRKLSITVVSHLSSDMFNAIHALTGRDQYGHRILAAFMHTI
jgi:hypothetical protein